MSICFQWRSAWFGSLEKYIFSQTITFGVRELIEEKNECLSERRHTEARKLNQIIDLEVLQVLDGCICCAISNFQTSLSNKF